MYGHPDSLDEIQPQQSDNMSPIKISEMMSPEDSQKYPNISKIFPSTLKREVAQGWWKMKRKERVRGIKKVFNKVVRVGRQGK